MSIIRYTDSYGTARHRRQAFTTASEPSSLVAAVQRHAALGGSRGALPTLRFLATGDVDGDVHALNIVELDHAARAIAAHLQEIGAQGERALLVYAPGLDFVAAFLGCLYAGVVAVPAYPPDPTRMARTLPRLRAIAHDSGARYFLTTAALQAFADAMIASAPELAELRPIATDALPLTAAERWQELDPAGSALAFLQYTSGSTGTPRGVMVTHANLVHNIRAILTVCPDPNPCMVSWLPSYHDMGLIGCILTPLYDGFDAILMSPLAFLERPLRWLEAISRYRATATAFPNFALDLTARRASDADVAKLDLSSWMYGMNGGEPVRRASIERFSQRFAACGFRAETHFPGYGMAENTLLIAGSRPRPSISYLELSRALLAQRRIGPARAQDSTSLVACGMAFEGEEIVIVNPESRHRTGADEVGEIWLRSSSVAAGYWQRPEESQRTFGARIADSDEGPFLRTGDLGLLRDGELFIVGRLKDVVIIRGQNYYPQDVEATAESAHPSVRPGSSAAVALEVAGHEQLAIVAEVRRGMPEPELAAVVRVIRESVADAHGIAPHTIALLNPGALPKTSSGKVQRYAARQGLMEGALDSVFTWTANGVQARDSELMRGAPPLAAAQADANASALDFLRTTLGAIVGIDGDQLDAERELAALGADSLAMVELLHALQDRFGARVTPAVVFEHRTLAALARVIETLQPTPAEHSESTTLAATLDSQPFPLSVSQQALWFLHRLAPRSPAYHISLLLERSEGWDAARARDAVQRVCEQHEVLRQRLVSCDSGLVHEPGRSFEWNEHEQLDIRGGAEKPFDLTQGPCLRVDFAPRAILFTVHHAVFDGYSCRVFLQDFLAAYGGEERPSARSYRDFVRWQSAFLTSPEAQRQERYWLERFATLPPVIDLPADCVRPARSRYRGDTVELKLDARAVQQLARETATTPSAVLLAAFFALQHRYTAQDTDASDLVVGTPLFGRTQRGFERTIGYFANMAALRERVSSQASFRELLAQVSQRLREALVHGDYPFARLVEKLSERQALLRDPARSPLFQTCFAFQGRAELPAGARAVSQGEGQFDVELEVFDAGDQYDAHWKFDCDLFTPETAARMAAHYVQLLAAAVAKPSTPIGKLSYITSQENALVSQVNATELNLDEAPLHIHGAADDIALVFPGGQWSYRELEARISQLARDLTDRDVGPESIVGICLPRGPEMVLAIHAIMRAGGAYLALDPEWPDARIGLILRDAQPVGVFAHESFARFAVPVWSCDSSHPIDATTERFTSRATADALAYVLYTSGSTGEPKGVLTEHRALANRVRWMQSRYPLTSADAVLQKTPFTFDVSVWEFMWPLSVGARLVVPPPHAHLDVSAMQEAIARHCITTCHFVPSMLGAFLSVAPVRAPALRQVFTSGEALAPELVSRFFAAYPGVELHNLYGPTEAAIDVSYWKCRTGEAPVPIGLPVANTRIHVLDATGAEAGLYVPGEIVLAGKQLARGYLHRPELTAQRFCELEGFGRVFRTGDIGRRRSDGAIEYLGRRDTQVKLRGVRIELDEIAATLKQHLGVKALAVAIDGPDSESQRLVAHVVSDVPESELARFAKEQLPRQLVPSQFVFHAALPLTASGKLDRQKLHAPAFVAPERTATALSPIERVFARFVPIDGPDTDFFRAGGTSLQAIRLVEALRRECGVESTLMDFYSAPTPRAILEQRRPAVPDLTEIVRELLPRLPVFAHAARTAPRRVLITGSTGFFGQHLLREWLSQSDATLYCLVRGRSARLPTHPRLVQVEGDLASLPSALANEIDTVVHNAARVHFLEPYQRLASANVEGTLAVLNFCATGRAKQLHYVSTASVFSGSDYSHADWIAEDAEPSARGLNSGYAASKWVAEQLVLAARARGLAVTLFRPGTLGGDSRTGRTQRTDFLPRLIEGARAIGVLPNLDAWVAFLPVDWAARALVCLALQGSHENYHLCHPQPIALREFARRLRLRVVPLSEFRRRLEACSQNALHPLLPLFSEPRGPAGQSEAELSQRLPRLEMGHAVADLAKLWPQAAAAPEMNEELLERYTTWLARMVPVTNDTLTEPMSSVHEWLAHEEPRSNQELV